MVSIPDCMEIISSALQMMRQLNGFSPANKHIISSFPLIQIKQSDIDVERECSICIDQFRLNNMVKKLPCRHLFHVECIDHWLSLRKTCPLCRKSVEESACGNQPSSLVRIGNRP